MPLSEYNVRQDAIIFQLSSERTAPVREQRHRDGVAARPAAALEHLRLSQILDVQLLLYYDGFFDAGLEQQSSASLPTAGKRLRGLSRCASIAPDELFFLRSQGNGGARASPRICSPSTRTTRG